MALYIKNHTLSKAIEFVNTLKGKTDEEMLILYYVNNLKTQIKDLEMKNNEYKEFFVKLNQFLPNNNIIYK